MTGTAKRKTQVTGENIGVSRDVSTVEVHDDGSESTTKSKGVSAQVGGGVQVGVRSETTSVTSGTSPRPTARRESTAAGSS